MPNTTNIHHHGTTLTDKLEMGHHGEHEDVNDTLRRLRTAGSITITPELFEKLYLSPQNQVKGELRRTFANPTPVSVMLTFFVSPKLQC
jgi:hypothetical protein